MDSMRPILARPPGSETDLLRLCRWTTIRITAFRLGSMLGLCLAVTSFSSPLRAADFRTLDFGAACDSVVTREQARGSVPIPREKISGADVYGFRGREYDRDLVLTYFCPKGVLFSGNYYFPVEVLETAIVSYRNTYDLLVSIYGAPFIDNTPWQVGGDTKDEHVVSSDPRKYMTGWRIPRLPATVSIMPSHKSENQGWRVFVVISRVKK